MLTNPTYYPIFCPRWGQILASTYGTDIVYPTNPTQQLYLFSKAGGAVLYQSAIDGKNYYCPALPVGFPFQISNVLKILATGTDWQGITRNTTVAADDLYWGGY